MASSTGRPSASIAHSGRPGTYSPAPVVSTARTGWGRKVAHALRVGQVAALRADVSSGCGARPSRAQSAAGLPPGPPRAPAARPSPSRWARAGSSPCSACAGHLARGRRVLSAVNTPQLPAQGAAPPTPSRAESPAAPRRSAPPPAAPAPRASTAASTQPLAPRVHDDVVLARIRHTDERRARRLVARGHERVHPRPRRASDARSAPPSPSRPTQPIIATCAPIFAAATAWLPPLPPGLFVTPRAQDRLARRGECAPRGSSRPCSGSRRPRSCPCPFLPSQRAHAQALKRAAPLHHAHAHGARPVRRLVHARQQLPARAVQHRQARALRAQRQRMRLARAPRIGRARQLAVDAPRRSSSAPRAPPSHRRTA